MKNTKFLAILNLLGFTITIVLNGLANGLPINGKTTGELSDMYPNLFVPAGMTFAIWGVIYLLMLVFIIYQLFAAFNKSISSQFITEIGPWFLISSLANASWILAWHYVLPGLSLIIMMILLASLIKIYLSVENVAGDSSGHLQYFVYPFFSIYLGWITVATIANVTTVLVDIGWNGGGAGEPFWAITMIIIAIGMGLYFLLFRQNMYYTIVIIWALYGIYLKRSSAEEFESGIILTTQIGLALSVVILSYLFFNKYMNPFSKGD